MKRLRRGSFMMYINNQAFEWDPVKADANFRKHGVRFHEATTVFDDPLASIEDDLRHSMAEHRQLAFGKSAYGNVLVVVFTERWERIRIISTWKASRKERREYEEKENRS
jgi:uncharacterized protein